VNKPIDNPRLFGEEAMADLRRRRRMGLILVEAGRLELNQAERIHQMQRDMGLPYGEAGQKLGLLSSEDVRYALGEQYGFPESIMADGIISPHLVVATAPTSPAAEAIKALRAQLVLGWLDGAASNTLSIVSAEEGEGRSFVAANLAIAFSQLNRRTLLIDTDLRQGTQHTLFGVDNKRGLSDILAGRDPTDSVKAASFCDHLWVLASGPRPPNPQELLSSDGMRRLLTQLRGTYDVVIADTGRAAGNGADAQLVAAYTKSAIVVSRMNRTPTRATAALVQKLNGAGVNVLGVVANDH